MLHFVPLRQTGREHAPLVVRLLRLWSHSRARGVNPLHAMTRLIGHHGSSPELAPACESCFTLTEACLGRSLKILRSGSSQLATDEVALVELLRQVPLLSALGPNSNVPHGLPGALQWAAMAVVRAISLEEDEPVTGASGSESPFGGCPFAPTAQVG